MKVADEVKDLTQQEQTVQGLIFTLVPTTNRTRATGKAEEGKQKRKRSKSSPTSQRRKPRV